MTVHRDETELNKQAGTALGSEAAAEAAARRTTDWAEAAPVAGKEKRATSAPAEGGLTTDLGRGDGALPIPDSVVQTLATLPDKPGVYIWRDAQGRAIYVGKAVNLKNRVRSYFRANTQAAQPKVRAQVRHVAEIETIQTDSEVEALMLECNLIKQYRPRYNIMLKDDKSYPYLKVTVQEEYPRLYVTRRLVKDGARYFGPYADVGAMHDTVKLLRAMFPIRHCRTMNQERPCLQYHIKRCLAPCQGLVSVREYRQMIENICMILDGKTQQLRGELKQQMQDAADAYRFEAAAARARDALQALDRLDEQQKAVLDGGDMDILGYAENEFAACLQVFFVRSGKLVGRKAFDFPRQGTGGRAPGGEGARSEPATDDEAREALPVTSGVVAVTTAFLKQYYSGEVFLPREVLLTAAPEEEERSAIEEWLRQRAGHKVLLTVPQRGDKVRLLQLACENAAKLLSEQVRKDRLKIADNLAAAEDLQQALGMVTPIGRMDCFDISHTQGTETVASMVVFRDGAPSKKDYRRYKIQSAEGKPDDFKSMQEVVYRRYKDYEDLPDLVVIDGGKGQLSSALEVVRGLGLHELKLVGLAKREEEIFEEGESEPIVLGRDTPALHLIQYIRDEAHRFAITYHRKLRAKRNLVSVLDHIPGLGPRRRTALWKQFKTLDAMKAASEEELAAVPGMNHAVAHTLYEFFRADALGKADIALK